MNRWRLGSFGLAAGLSPINEPSTGSWDKVDKSRGEVETELWTNRKEL